MTDSKPGRGHWAAAWLLCALATLACATADPERDAASPVVAVLSGEEITETELDAWIRDRLFEREVSSKSDSEQFEIRSQALDAWLDQRIVEAEAERRGVAPEVALEQLAGEGEAVDETEVSEFFERHRERFGPEDTLEQRSPMIRRYLEDERRGRVIAELRKAAGVEVKFQAPRQQVAAVGASRGPADAPVTIVEFSDYQCPFCARAEPTVDQVLARYPEKVRVVYRHLPLESIHPQARGAAEAAVCAEAQGRFWEYHQRLFADPNALAEESLLAYAKDLSLDLEAFAQCRESEETRARVQRDVDDAAALGIRGTPAFFVNGVSMRGAQPLSEFERVIEAELASAP